MSSVPSDIPPAVHGHQWLRTPYGWQSVPEHVLAASGHAPASIRLPESLFRGPAASRLPAYYFPDAKLGAFFDDNIWTRSFEDVQGTRARSPTQPRRRHPSVRGPSETRTRSTSPLLELPAPVRPAPTVPQPTGARPTGARPKHSSTACSPEDLE